MSDHETKGRYFFVGTDTNERRGKATRKASSAPAPTNPFSSRAVDSGRGVLEDVPDCTRVLAMVAEGGRAVILGHTRDGGAWVVQVLDGQERFKSYASSQSELDDLFAQLHEAYG